MNYKGAETGREHHVTVEPEISFFDGHDPHYTVGAKGVMEADGTHYEVVAIPVSDTFQNRGMGGFPKDQAGYIVIAFPFNQAYLMSATNYLSTGYVEQKLMSRGSTCDAENIAYLWEKVRIKANIRFDRPKPYNTYSE